MTDPHDSHHQQAGLALTTPAPSSPWDSGICLKLIEQLWTLRRSMLAREEELGSELAEVAAQHQDSARNLVHYLALRSVDLRPLQHQLTWLGLSSLGRSESHVLANLDKVLGILHRLTGQPWQELSSEEPSGMLTSQTLIDQNSLNLLGPAPANRAVRIMVTLPGEAATDPDVAVELVTAGMDIARINCAHDDAGAWQAMAANVRHAAKLAKRPIKILMDLGGPKIRTGALPAQPPVLKLKPAKDEMGHAFRAARLHLRPIGSTVVVPDVNACIGVWETWLERLKVGATIDFCDSRGAKRHLLVVQRDERGAIAESLQTAYLTPETVLTVGSASGKKKRSTLVCQIEGMPGALHLKSGDFLRLTKENAFSQEDVEDEMPEGLGDIAQISCTLPQVIDQVRAGERIWFDDGRIGGVIRQQLHDHLLVEILHARDGGQKLTGDKGINLPDSQLHLPALSEKDVQDLAAVAELADMVGLSFVQKPADVELLRDHLKVLGREDMGLVLKIETLQGFENLPELMLAAMATPSAGIMIARGDLAVECGYERLAEVQEEILWCAEAAHLPVIWATQVLESLAKTGLPSRAEISDAGLGVRAECVMLNKGPYITSAIRTLNDILQRMSGHQAKKRPLLRALQAWGGSDPAAASAGKSRRSKAAKNNDVLGL